MVLRFFSFAAIFLFASCTEMGERDNPDDPKSKNYSKGVLSGSSSSSAPSSSSVLSSSSAAVPSSSATVPSSSSVLPSSSSAAEPSSSSAKSSSSSLPSSSSSIEPSSSSSADLCERFSSSSTSFCDSRDGKIYKWVPIGTQTWMAENLDYAAGDSKCYEGKPANCETYGRLYDWNTAKTVCPDGWHLSTYYEWDELIKDVETSNCTEKCAGKYLKAESGWNKGNGLDSYKFSALPGGSFNSSSNFSNVGSLGFWWTYSEYESDFNTTAYRFCIDDTSESITFSYQNKNNLYSVRCVKNN